MGFSLTSIIIEFGILRFTFTYSIYLLLFIFVLIFSISYENKFLPVLIFDKFFTSVFVRISLLTIFIFFKLKKSLLIKSITPKAYTAENHQEYNAKSIEAQGAGIAILEKDLTPQSLNDAVFKLLGDKELLIDMENNAKKIGKPEAIDLIYNEIMKSYNEAVGSKNKKEKQAESKENILEEQVSKEPKVIGIKKK